MTDILLDLGKFPSAVNKYQQAKIYKIVCEHCNEIYVGSTCEKYLSCRLGKHKSGSKKPENCSRRFYSHMNEYGWDKARIILIENFPCNSVNELRAREDLYIQALTPSFNNNNAVIYTDKLTYIKEMHKSYVEEKKYHCEACNISCSAPKDLAKHLNSVAHVNKCHELGILAAPVQKITCPTCGIEFTQKSSLTKHIKRQHSLPVIPSNITLVLN